MWERIRTMLTKEFIQLFRDPRMRAVVFVIPIVQLVVFGYAATTDVRNAATAIFDLDNTPASRDFLSRFTQSGYFQATETIDSETRAHEVIDRGLACAVIRIDKGFQQILDAGHTVKVQLILDGTDSNTAGIILSYASRIASRFSSNVLVSRFDRLQGAARRPGQIDLQSRAWFNENLDSQNFYVPGVMANMVTLITLMLTSMAVVREREIGTMEQVMVTPIRPLEFILGKTVPFILVAFIDVLLVTAVGVFWFGVPIRGNLLLLLACTGLFLLPAVGLGLLISTICQTQQQAMMSTFFIFFPAMLLSGFAYPISNMPPPVQWLTLANPLRHYLTIIRSIFLKGVGTNILWPEMTALALLGVVLLFLAVRRFHKTLG